MVSKEIIKQLSPESSLMALECDIDRIHVLEQIEHHDICIIHADAKNIADYCEKESIDIVISTLPLGSLERTEVDVILQKVHLVLKR